jgi:hypothetical protein
MTFSRQSTGDKRVDAVFGEVYRVINLLELEISKKADKRLLDSLIQALEAGGDLPALKYWRRIEDGHNLKWQYDSTFGAGTPNWVTYDTYKPDS